MFGYCIVRKKLLDAWRKDSQDVDVLRRMAVKDAEKIACLRRKESHDAEEALRMQKELSCLKGELLRLQSIEEKYKRLTARDEKGRFVGKGGAS